MCSGLGVWERSQAELSSQIPSCELDRGREPGRVAELPWTERQVLRVEPGRRPVSVTLHLRVCSVTLL